MEKIGLPHFFNSHNNTVRGVAFNPCERYIFCSGGNDGNICLYHAGRAELLSIYTVISMGLNRHISAVSFTSDGKKILAVTTSKRLSVLDTERGTPIICFENCAFSGRERAALAADPQSPNVAVCSYVNGKGITLFDLRMPLPLDFLFDFHSDVIRDIKFLNESWPFSKLSQNSLLTLSSQGVAKVTTIDGRFLHSFDFNHVANSIVCTPEPFGSAQSYGFSSALVTGGTVISSYAPSEEYLFNNLVVTDNRRLSGSSVSSSTSITNINNSPNNNNAASSNPPHYHQHSTTAGARSYLYYQPSSMQNVTSRMGGTNATASDTTTTNSSRSNSISSNISNLLSQRRGDSLFSWDSSEISRAIRQIVASSHQQLNHSSSNVILSSSSSSSSSTNNTATTTRDRPVGIFSDYAVSVQQRSPQSSNHSSNAQSFTTITNQLNQSNSNDSVTSGNNNNNNNNNNFTSGNISTLNHSSNSSSNNSAANSPNSQYDNLDNNNLINVTSLMSSFVPNHLFFHDRWDHSNSDRPQQIWRLRYSSNGALLYAAGEGGAVRRYRRFPNSTLKCLGEIYRHRGDIVDMDISPYDEYIVTASKDKTVGLVCLGSPSHGWTEYYELT